MEKIADLVKNKQWLEKWFQDVEKIGTTPCVQPSSAAHQAMEGLAATLGALNHVEKCMV